MVHSITFLLKSVFLVEKHSLAVVLRNKSFGTKDSIAAANIPPFIYGL